MSTMPKRFRRYREIAVDRQCPALMNGSGRGVPLGAPWAPTRVCIIPNLATMLSFGGHMHGIVA